MQFMKKMVGAATLAALPLMAAPLAHADVFDVCPSGSSGIVTSVTSCPFADNVRASWMNAPSSFITAYSPVTGRAYSMACGNQVVMFTSGQSRVAVQCQGGNDAMVVFW